MAGAADSRWLRREPAGGRIGDRHQHVPYQGRELGHVATDATLAPGSTFAMTFILPIELADAEVRPGLQQAANGARASETPFLSFFTPAEMLALARDAGFRAARHVSAADLGERYFAGRTGELRPPKNGEELLVATT